jgi:hypothetical protein
VSSADRVGRLIAPAELLRTRKRLESGNRRADWEAEVERPDVPALVDELVRVLLQPEIPEGRGGEWSEAGGKEG